MAPAPRAVRRGSELSPPHSCTCRQHANCWWFETSFEAMLAPLSATQYGPPSRRQFLPRSPLGPRLDGYRPGRPHAAPLMPAPIRTQSPLAVGQHLQIGLAGEAKQTNGRLPSQAPTPHLVARRLLQHPPRLRRFDSADLELEREAQKVAAVECNKSVRCDDEGARACAPN